MSSGFLLINKQKDWTSHDVVAYLRGATKTKKVGHAGTLDPFATGLLIIGIGREATKRLDEFKALPKKYIATIYLGATSDTLDSTGKITHPSLKLRRASTKTINNILKKFTGKQKQTPPMYSAKKIKGKKLYELAREGIEVKRKPVDIEIYNIKLISYKYPYLKIEVSCSTGTYIRSLADDIGRELGCGGYCDELERVEIGEYSVKNAIDPKKIDRENLQYINVH
jgi:tRNA pseudouridine55 synthase